MGLEERFWSKVARTQDATRCWPWLGAKNPQKYGSFKFNGRGMSAHRAAYLLTYGSIPAGLCVLHRCDNPSCVNPDHLFLGTKRDNTQDAIAKGRDRLWLDPIRASWAKLSKAERIALTEGKLKAAWAAGAVWWSERTPQERSARARRAALARWAKHAEPDTNT